MEINDCSFEGIKEELLKIGVDPKFANIFEIVQALNNLNNVNSYYVIDTHTIGCTPVYFGSDLVLNIDWNFDCEDLLRFPHKCPNCFSPAYVSPLSGKVDCSKKCRD